MFMSDLDWVVFPKVRRPMATMDEFFNMDHDIEALWSDMAQTSPLKKVKTSTTSSNTNNENKKEIPRGTWTEMSSTLNTIHQGPRVVSRRTVRVRDGSGRDELLEERNLDGHVSKRVTNFSSNKHIETSGKSDTFTGVASEDKESQAMVTSTDEFDQLWENDNLVKQLLGTKTQKKFSKQSKQSVVQNARLQQQTNPQPVEQPMPMETTETQPKNTNEVPTPTPTPIPIPIPTTGPAIAPIPVTTSAPTPDLASEFPSQLQQIAQLGLPCDSSAYNLLQLTKGNVEQAVMGLLSLQRMKALGFEDDAKCLNALYNNNFNIDKACQQMRATQSLV
jgi:hypothetical protein